MRRDAIRVLLSNAGSLVKDKIRRLGQANVPEGEANEALARTVSRTLQKPTENSDDEVLMDGVVVINQNVCRNERQKCYLENHIVKSSSLEGLVLCSGYKTDRQGIRGGEE